MRVLMITGSFPPDKCGVGDYTYNLVRGLASSGQITIKVVTSSGDTARSAAAGIEVDAVMRKWSLLEAGKILRILREWAPDIVHIQFPTQGYGRGWLPWLLPALCALAGRRVVQTWHERFSLVQAPKYFFKAIVPGGLIVVRPSYRANLPWLLRWGTWNKKMVYLQGASAIPKIAMSASARLALRGQMLGAQQRLVVYFGFIYPIKGVEHLFDIADPLTDQLVLAGEVLAGSNYGEHIRDLAASERWRGKVTFAGFLPVPEAAALLHAADAVVLPFREGGGDWNTSLQGAVLQETFVVTTSKTRAGYDAGSNVYFAPVDDVATMKKALDQYAGTRRPYSPDIDHDAWQDVAAQHQALYQSLTRSVTRSAPATKGTQA